MHFGTFHRPPYIGIEDLEKIDSLLSRFAHKTSANMNPTRGILDLFLANNPATLNRIEVIPGLSDHDAIIDYILQCFHFQ